MRFLLVLSAFGLVGAQDYGRVDAYRDTFAAAAGTFDTKKAGTGTTGFEVDDYRPHETGTDRNPYVEGNDSDGDAYTTASAQRAGDRATRSSAATSGTDTTGFKNALNQLASILKTQLDDTKASLDVKEQTFDKDKCNFEKLIKKNEAKAADEQKRLDTATAQHAKWDAQHKKFEGEKAAEKNAMEATHEPIVNACTSWANYVCSASDSLLNQLHQAVDDAALMYAALSKLAERRAEFNFGATLGLVQMTPEQTEKIEVTEEDMEELRRIDGLTAMVQQQVNAKLKQPYGSGGGGVVGALKGIYDTVVTNAQRLVEELNTHGIAGDADHLDSSVTTTTCVQLGLGGCSGTDCAACPATTDTYDDVKWDRVKPAGADTFSALMRTQLAQRKAHESKFEYISTSLTDADNQRAMWKSKETDASDKLREARETAASATRDLQECRSTYDAEVSDHQDLISGLNSALETLSDPSVVASTTDDAMTFIQIEKPVGLIQTTMEKAKLELTQKTELAVQADGFSSVITAMQKMIANLQVQIQDELDRKAWCTDEVAEATATRTSISNDVDTLKANLQNMNNDIATYTEDIASWEEHAKAIEEQFNNDMDTCQRDLGDAQKEKDDAAVNERMYSKISGVLTNLRLPTSGTNVRNLLLCDMNDAGHTGNGSWGCTKNGHVTVLLAEARKIQDNESARIEKIHRWCNGQRDIYAVNIRNAKSNLAEQNVLLATAREEARKTDAQLLHANAAFSSAEDYEDDITHECSGLISGVQMRGGEWAKEITALTSIIEMLTTGAVPS